ncbi:universal stress protein [Mucilaginibacter sp. SMC90]|uniref:universal stress protein n=1 Tax=Mucilaginibacter sp. SMC90 TaxID=2929803 RepID=UPI001FB38528|nr:universal stress protein [Mucilaginibacter sp. SMC90]UOE49801.1 universal stress protein [Mucilaginibacter sp. SMC90]
MKKIAVLTDFSERAFNAAAYALSLATEIHADILLYNSFLVPSAEPLSGQISWPEEDYEAIKSGCEADLKLFKSKLEERLENLPAGFRPVIECRAQDGAFELTIDEFISGRDIILLVMADHHKGFASLISGNHTHEVLDHTILPLLIVPEQARFEKICKIAFATDLDRDDLNVVQSLASLARPFNAEILLTHLEKTAAEDDPQVGDFLTEVGNKINYSHIYYRQLIEPHVQQGLHHMAKTIDADVVVMVHRHKDILSRLFGRSHSQRLAESITLPLLIFPHTTDPLPVF